MSYFFGARITLQEDLGRGMRRGRVRGQTRERNHAFFLAHEANLRCLVKNDPDWREEDVDKWLKNTKEEREDAKKKFVEEQRELVEREQQEAAERDADATADADAVADSDADEDEDGSDQECEHCGGLDHLPDGNLLLVCDVRGCLGASHLGCCNPPLQRVPEEDVSI